MHAGRPETICFQDLQFFYILIELYIVYKTKNRENTLNLFMPSVLEHSGSGGRALDWGLKGC